MPRSRSLRTYRMEIELTRVIVVELRAISEASARRFGALAARDRVMPPGVVTSDSLSSALRGVTEVES